MKFSEWLDAAPGRTSQAAGHFGVTVSAITQWRKAVPVNRMAAVNAYTKGAVSLADMVPGAVSKRRNRVEM